MRRAINILVLLLLCFPAFGQTEQINREVEIYFRHNSFAIDLNYRQNRATLDEISDLISTLHDDSAYQIDRIEVNSYTSPEGGKQLNDLLSINRTNSLYDHLTRQMLLPDTLIVKNNSGTDWDGLHELIEASDLKYRDAVLHILDNTPEETWVRVRPNDRWLTLVDSRNKHLADLQGGVPYQDMFANIYPKLRRGSVVTIYYHTIAPIVAKEDPILAASPALFPDSEPTLDQLYIPEQQSSVEYIRKPLLAIKTNLLFDVATVLNISAELPIGNRLSLAGEWVFPWWTWDDGTPESLRHRLQLLYGNIEARYWFGSRTDREVLTGWYAGLYTGGGKYDFEYDRTGVQGEFFVAAGLSAGYAHSINKMNTLRMEYSASLGVIQTNYRDYNAIYADTYDEKWHPIRRSTGTYTYVGPTALKVSLVWMLYYNKKKGASK